MSPPPRALPVAAGSRVPSASASASDCLHRGDRAQGLCSDRVSLLRQRKEKSALVVAAPAFVKRLFRVIARRSLHAIPSLSDSASLTFIQCLNRRVSTASSGVNLLDPCRSAQGTP
ncbi:hypothetical protein BT93_L1107 [Corymbia citriodora subsp. variegata]|uniref:Uncharacterized protein n=1 Tax=Corymbia citriodora subsp. variegata TaxID=360336 RepID=A0A8T0CWM8_CORYI|nr:hypothetical protein BT93_L1107 [Corymbia citriodora subsp. variegata]